MILKYTAYFYFAQAGLGFVVGIAWPWLRLWGWL